jgi:ABC-type transport system involved in cytochrome c biogenesis permease subunit
LRSHYRLEFFNAFGLPFLFVLNSIIHKQPIGINAIAAIFLNGIILLEGSYLWYSIYRKLTGKLETNYIPILGIFRSINLLLIILTVSIIVSNQFKSAFEQIGTIIFLILAILEHINYYEFQLMYDSKNDLKYLRLFKRLKKSKLKILIGNYEKNIN